MKEQLERDIEVLRKIEWLLNEELSQDTFYEYDFMEEWEEFKLAKSHLEFRLKSLEAKEKEVTIWDVIEECKGVTEADKLIKVLGKYEINLSNKYNRYSDEWFELVEHKEVISDPVSFIYRGYQLRLKERK